MRWVVDACRPYLEDKDEPSVAFLPMASLNVNQWLEYTVREFKGLAQVDLLDTDRMDLPTMESIIRRARVVYISGGNTFLLNHRLYISGLLPFLRKKVQAGLPVVGFSAGAIVCGPNILTSKDMNSVQTDRFDALNATPFNFLAHYDADAYGQSAEHDDWVSDYHVFHDNPVMMLSDGAYVKVEGKKMTLVRGDAWILRKDSEKEKLKVGGAIVP
jgi:dipeptidase E